MSKNEVIIDINSNGVAIITLNRPHVLNSININMVRIIKDNLTKWESNKDIKVVLIKGAGDRAFCAGGDIKSIYEAKNNDEIKRMAHSFFEEEYILDEYIYHYSKPIIAILDGIVMGGGIGLTYGAKYKIVTEKTRWAMPEVNLGFFPDVGGSYFLNQMPGNIGIYLALTGNMIHGADVLYANAADYLVPSNVLEDCINDIMNEPKISANSMLESLIKKYCKVSCKSDLETKERLINQHFKYKSMEEIMSSLKKDESSFAKETYRLLTSKSPVSLKVILKQLIDSKGKSISECLEMDRILVSNFLNHNDFYEGVRSILIDKDKHPKYEYSNLEDVSEVVVNRFFK